MSKASLTTGRALTYDHALWTGKGRWRGVAALVLLVVGFFVISTVITAGGAQLESAVGAAPTPGAPAVTPLVLLTINLSIIALWPLAVLLQWWLFGVRPGLLSSVQGRFRWRWFGHVACVIVPVFAAYGVAAALVVPPGPVRLDADALGLLLVVVATTPFQAVAEEYAMRGLVQRSIGSWFRRAGAALVVSTAATSALFALMHASPDPWRVAFYLALGVAASLAAWGTGGLEASVAIHAANNLIIALPAALTGGSADLVARDTDVGAIAAVPTMVVLACSAIAVWLARRAGLTTTQETGSKGIS